MRTRRRSLTKSRARRERHPSTAAKSPRRSGAILLAVLIVAVSTVVFFTHRPALRAQALSFDDYDYLVNNTLVQRPGWTSAGRFLTEVFEPSTVRGYYQPLAMMSLMLDHAAGGRQTDLRAFHRTSLLLHVVNTSLVVLLLYFLFGDVWIAAMVGLLFGLHPLMVEPICWLGERKTLLATAFALGGLIVYVRYTQKQSWPRYAACLALCVLAMMSKPTTTPLPVLLLLLDYWPLRRLNRRTLLEKLPFFVIAGLFAIVTLSSQGRTAELAVSRGQSTFDFPLIFCHNTVFYPYKMLWPAELSSIYPFPEPLSLSHPAILAGVIGTGLWMIVLVISLRWTRALIASWLFFFVALLPTLMVSAYSLGIAADKYVYLPSIGVLLLMAWGASGLWNRSGSVRGRVLRRSTIVAMFFVAAALEVRATQRQLSYWQDTEILHWHILRGAPESVEARLSLGVHFKTQGRNDEAITLAREALDRAPNDYRAYMLLGNALSQKDQLAEAITHLSKAVDIGPEEPTAHNNLGIALGKRGDLANAKPHFIRAIELNPDYADAYSNLGNCYIDKADLDKAITCYEQALRLKPDFIGAMKNLASVLLEQGRPGEAIERCRTILRIHPNHPEALHLLKIALAEKAR